MQHILQEPRTREDIKDLRNGTVKCVLLCVYTRGLSLLPCNPRVVKLYHIYFEHSLEVSDACLYVCGCKYQAVLGSYSLPPPLHPLLFLQHSPLFSSAFWSLLLLLLFPLLPLYLFHLSPTLPFIFLLPPHAVPSSSSPRFQHARQALHSELRPQLGV